MIVRPAVAAGSFAESNGATAAAAVVIRFNSLVIAVALPWPPPENATIVSAADSLSKPVKVRLARVGLPPAASNKPQVGDASVLVFWYIALLVVSISSAPGEASPAKVPAAPLVGVPALVK